MSFELIKHFGTNKLRWKAFLISSVCFLTKNQTGKIRIIDTKFATEPNVKKKRVGLSMLQYDILKDG